MSKTTENLGNASTKKYAIGFALSLILTFAAYFLVVEKILSGWTLNLTIAGLGLLQAWIQILYFLNMRKEPKPHWNHVVFILMAATVLLVVFGSLWIMAHLNYNLMIPNVQNLP